MLRKQIAMIIPTCRPLTALKHPSIRAALKQSSLSGALSRTVSPTTPPPPPPPQSSQTFHSSRCVNCLRRRGERWPCSLTRAPRWRRRPGHSAFCGAGSVWKKTPEGLFLNFGHTAGRGREQRRSHSLSPARALRLRAVVPSRSIELYRGCDGGLEGIQQIETTALKVCVSGGGCVFTPFICLLVDLFVCQQH